MKRYAGNVGDRHEGPMPRCRRMEEESAQKCARCSNPVGMGYSTIIERGEEGLPMTISVCPQCFEEVAGEDFTVYHGTTADAVEKIVETGYIDPGRKDVWGPGVSGEEGRTYVTLDEECAWVWSGGVDQDEPGAVLRFKVPSGCIRYREGDEGGVDDYYICRKVPVEDIEVKYERGGWKPLGHCRREEK